VPLPQTPAGRTVLQVQQDLAALTIDELPAFLMKIADQWRLPLTPVLALSQVALTGGPLITKTYAREEWLDLLRAGRCFSGYNSRAASAANLSMVQLWNPAASGVRVLVFGAAAYISVAMAAGNMVHLYVDNTQRTNNTGQRRQNLLVGGPAAVAEVRQDLTPALPPAFAADAMISEQFGPAAFTLLDFQPVRSGMPQGFFAELAPGQGITLIQDIVNISLFGYYQWAEVPLTY
jgi:hypothetical protein